MFIETGSVFSRQVYNSNYLVSIIKGVGSQLAFRTDVTIFICEALRSDDKIRMIAAQCIIRESFHD